MSTCLGHAWKSDLFTVGLLYEALKRCRLPGGLSPQEVFRQSTLLSELLYTIIARNPTKVPGVLRELLVELKFHQRRTEVQLGKGVLDFVLPAKYLTRLHAHIYIHNI